MLDQETKRKIDRVRDILVGKIPDPTAQVEQITTALIYKFMHDMDEGSKSLGGRASFFAGEFKKYSWPALVNARLSGRERLSLYKSALKKIPLNPRLPPLFRNIFKSARLPYEDPETLNLFLKEISGFSYDHSENLGNAFEYLLSILGSQGDAGQFRTPRHIIDFMVEAAAPSKEETVLDPACGTAGFLISAYRHIIKNSSKNYNPEKACHSFMQPEGSAAMAQIQSNGGYRGEKLTPFEKKQIQKNIIGYDISSKMVRLSLVNMYLHRFQQPKIYEYDTLTSEDRWDDDFDVILANPPFMSPKGGIRPHGRFSVKAGRSEVLFVDYIADHLTLNGRAAVIVPEGVVFKSDKAYKSLRKALVENRILWAVASLPAKVFEPYSGVKTSILFLDKKRAQVNKEILFLDVHNDGFELGARRRKIDKNDLPEILRVLKAWQEGKKIKSSLAHWVMKEKIIESSDWNLTSNRYKEIQLRPTKYPIVRLGEVITLEYGKPLKKQDRRDGAYPVFGSNGPVGCHDKYLVKGPFIIVGRKGTAGAVTYSNESGYPIDTAFYVKIKDQGRLHLKFLYFIMKELGLDKINKQAGVPGLNRNDAYRVKIPLPPIKIQKEIVAEIEKERSHIESCKKLIELNQEKIRQKISAVWEKNKL